jgi:hypothetical protein
MKQAQFLRLCCLVFAIAPELQGQDVLHISHPQRFTCYNGQTTAAPAKSPWITITSLHFEVRTNAGEETGREVLAHFEQVRRFFFRDLKETSVSSERVSVVAFASEEDFAPYRTKEFAHGYYYRSENREFIVLLVDSADLINLIGVTHEYVHLLVSHHNWNPAPWLNEGLAEFYSTLAVKQESVQVGTTIPGAVESLKSTDILPLKQLFAVNDRSPYYNETAKANVFYTSAWALIHMLTFSPKYAGRFSEFVTAVSAGQSSEGALVRSFRQPLTVVEQDLRDYVRHGILPAVTLPGIAGVRDSSGAVRLMKNSEIKRILGQLPKAPRQKKPKPLTNANKRDSNSEHTASTAPPETEGKGDRNAPQATAEAEGLNRPSILLHKDDGQPVRSATPCTEGTAQGTPIVDTRANEREPAIPQQLEATRSSPAPPKAAGTTSVTGHFVFLECLGRSARIVLESERGKEKFLINDPGNVAIVGRNGAAVDLSCGAQKGMPVQIGYEAIAGDHSVVGIVKSIQF